MRFATVCSGIGAPEVAWTPLGWTPLFCSEIARFPCAVLAYRFPHVPNLGDFTEIDDAQLARFRPIDVLVGGLPCQSFSVAGKRAGLRDPRGVLAFEFLRLAQRARARWLLFENVPGLLSSNGGRDFGAFLGALGDGGYGFAYRILDARYFGLAQRRARVFVVGHLGDWRRAAAVLLERASLSWNPPTGLNARPETAAPPPRGAENHGHGEYAGRRHEPPVNLLAFAPQSGGNPRFCIGDNAPTLTVHRMYQLRNPLLHDTMVRRFTPREYERLQGFPDDYTRIPGAKDTPRYRALGNSMAVPVIRYLGERIALVDSLG